MNLKTILYREGIVYAVMGEVPKEPERWRYEDEASYRIGIKHYQNLLSDLKSTAVRFEDQEAIKYKLWGDGEQLYHWLMTEGFHSVDIEVEIEEVIGKNWGPEKVAVIKRMN